jgi:hypothetical protein
MKDLKDLIKENINEARIQDIQLKIDGKDIVKDIENAIEEITYVYNEEIGILFDKRELEKIKKELNNYINKFFIENEDEDD